MFPARIEQYAEAVKNYITYLPVMFFLTVIPHYLAEEFIRFFPHGDLSLLLGYLFFVYIAIAFSFALLLNWVYDGTVAGPSEKCLNFFFLNSIFFSPRITHTGRLRTYLYMLFFCVLNCVIVAFIFPEPPREILLGGNAVYAVLMVVFYLQHRSKMNPDEPGSSLTHVLTAFGVISIIYLWIGGFLLLMLSSIR